MNRGLVAEDDHGLRRVTRESVSDPIGTTVPGVSSCCGPVRCLAATAGAVAVGAAAAAWRDGQCPSCESEVGSALFDRGILDELASMLDDDEIDSYLALLEPTVTPRVEKLLRQQEAGEINGVVETAHALAGGAACYGLLALSAVARLVETGARSEPREALYRAVTEAANLVEASLAAVFRWRCRSRADRDGALTPSPAEARTLTGAIVAP